MNEEKNTSSISLPSFNQYNKLHWMLGGEVYAMKMAKDMFIQDLKKAQTAEKELCKKTKRDPCMTDSTFARVCDLLDQCRTFYEVEALARYVFDDNYLPEVEEVRSRGKALKDIVPIWDWLRSNPNPKRSY